MSNQSIKEIINKLNKGILSPELDFNHKEETDNFWDKVRYNTFYKDPRYYANKFPNPQAFMNLPGAYDIVNEMAENSKSPLEEILVRQQYIVKEISNDNINESTE